MSDPNSVTGLWIITVSVIGLVILFFGIAKLVSSRRVTRKHGSPAVPAGAVAAVASLEQARSVAKAADQAQDEAVRRGGTLLTVRADEETATRADSILDRSGVAAAARRDAYRESGWSRFDEAGAPLSREEIEAERNRYSI